MSSNDYPVESRMMADLCGFFLKRESRLA